MFAEWRWTWAVVGFLAGPTLMLLGRWLPYAIGRDFNNSQWVATRTTERWHPLLGHSTKGPDLTRPQLRPRLTRLRDGSVLMLGEETAKGIEVDRLAPAAKRFAKASPLVMSEARALFTLAGDAVALGGGSSNVLAAQFSAETGNWVEARLAGHQLAGAGAVDATHAWLVTQSTASGDKSELYEYDAEKKAWSAGLALPIAVSECKVLPVGGGAAVVQSADAGPGRAEPILLFIERGGSKLVVRRLAREPKAGELALRSHEGRVLESRGDVWQLSLEHGGFIAFDQNWPPKRADIQGMDDELNNPRARGAGHLLLPDGRVEILGGAVDDLTQQPAHDVVIDSVRIADESGAGPVVGHLLEPRSDFGLIRMSDDEWLLVGGRGASGGADQEAIGELVPALVVLLAAVAAPILLCRRVSFALGPLLSGAGAFVLAWSIAFILALSGFRSPS